MRYLLDTTLLVDHVLGRHGAPEVVERLFGETGDLYVCDAVVAEALSRGTDAEVAIMERLIRALEYVATTPAAASEAGALRRSASRTSPRQLGDALIAAVAADIDAVVVTRTPSDFERLGVGVLGYGTPSIQPA